MNGRKVSELCANTVKIIHTMQKIPFKTIVILYCDDYLLVVSKLFLVEIHIYYGLKTNNILLFLTGIAIINILFQKNY